MASAIYKRFRRGEISEEEGHDRLTDFGWVSLGIVTPPGLATRAFDLSTEFNWALPYDAFYLALGEILDCEVWTADGRFHGDAHVKYPRLRCISEYV